MQLENTYQESVSLPSTKPRNGSVITGASENRLAISTMSLGRAWHHKLCPKLEAAASSGFEGIELFFEDLEYHAQDKFGAAGPEELVAAAEHVRNVCARLGLEIICLQPLMFNEGLRDPAAQAAAMERAVVYFRVANALETDIVAVPSSFVDGSLISNDPAAMVGQLRRLADLAASYRLRLVYEALCWGTHVDRWEQSWAVVQAVDRPNFGLCLDTFNIAGRIYADPTAPGGVAADADAALEASVRNLIARLAANPAKIFYIQVVDAERLAAPLVDATHPYYDPAQPPRMSWSRNCRLFYGERDRGAYLPVRRLVEAIVHGVGFRGWISMELFNRSMADPDPRTPRRHARRGAAAWVRLQRDLGFGQPSSASASLSSLSLSSAATVNQSRL